MNNKDLYDLIIAANVIPDFISFFLHILSSWVSKRCIPNISILGCMKVTLKVLCGWIGAGNEVGGAGWVGWVGSYPLLCQYQLAFRFTRAVTIFIFVFLYQRISL